MDIARTPWRRDAGHCPASTALRALRAAARRGLAGLLLVSGLAHAPLLRAETIVHRERSAIQTVIVVDSDTRRCLRFDDAPAALNQSCVAFADPLRLEFAYTRAMVVTLLLWRPEPRRVLVIGVGGGSIPMALSSLLPQASIDAVDIDPVVIEVARSHFGLQTSERLRAIAADGRAFVRDAVRAGMRYDAVLLDAFDNDGIPPALFDRAFLRDVRALLPSDGVFMANTFAGSASYARESATAEAVFGAFLNIKLGGDADGNRLLVAGRSATPSPQALLQAAPSRSGALARIGATDEWLQSWRFVGRDWVARGRAGTTGR